MPMSLRDGQTTHITVLQKAGSACIYLSVTSLMKHNDKLTAHSISSCCCNTARDIKAINTLHERRQLHTTHKQREKRAVNVTTNCYNRG